MSGAIYNNNIPNGFFIICDDISPLETNKDTHHTFLCINCLDLNENDCLKTISLVNPDQIFCTLTDSYIFSLNLKESTSKFNLETYEAISINREINPSKHFYEKLQRTVNLLLANATAQAFEKEDLVTPASVIKGGIINRTSIAEGINSLLKDRHPSNILFNIENNRSKIPDELLEKTPRFNLSDILIAEISNNKIVRKDIQINLPTHISEEFKAIGFVSEFDQGEHLALIYGDLNCNITPLIRVHAEERISELLNLKNTKEKIDKALLKIRENGCGAFIYIRRRKRLELAKEAKRINGNTSNRTDANKPHTGTNFSGNNSSGGNYSIPEIGIGSQIIKELGVKDFNLLSNSKWSKNELALFGLTINQIINY